jgi:tetratricopeptide (TPR) repeat protein
MLVDAAYRSYQGGDYSGSIKRLESAKTYEETAYLYQTWGIIERDEGAFGTARGRFRRALELDPSQLPTWRIWGNMENRLDNFEVAARCFSKASVLPGSDPQDSHSFGVSLSRLFRKGVRVEQRQPLLEDSLKALQKGYHPNPFGYRETHHNVVNSHALAITLMRLGRIEDALAECRKGLDLEPSNIRLIRLRRKLEP